MKSDPPMPDDEVSLVPRERPVLCPASRPSVLWIEPSVADTMHVLDRRKAGVDGQEFSPNPLYERADIYGVPESAAAGDEPCIVRCIIDGAVGLDARARYQQPHDLVFGD